MLGIIAAVKRGQTELWIAPRQELNIVKGRDILSCLTTKGLLDSCASLGELKAIQTKGLEFFREHFEHKMVFAWRSVDGIRVSYLVDIGDAVVLSWDRIDRCFTLLDVALRRKT